jgi:hypothetical protein
MQSSGVHHSAVFLRVLKPFTHFFIQHTIPKIIQMKGHYHFRTYIQKSWRTLLALAGIFLGFNATVAAQYGVIETTFRINGNIHSAACNIPLEHINIKAEGQPQDKNDDPYVMTGETDSNGNFIIVLDRYHLADNIRIAASSPDRRYRDTVFVIPAAIGNFISGQRGGWHIDYEYKDPVDIRLTDTGVPPCKRTSIVPDPPDSTQTPAP